MKVGLTTFGFSALVFFVMAATALAVESSPDLGSGGKGARNLITQNPMRRLR